MPIIGRVAADLPTTLQTTDYILVDDDFGTEVRMQDNGVTALTATLPSASAVGNGYNAIIRNIGTLNLNVASSGGNIDGALPPVTFAPGEWRWLSSDGNEWTSVARSAENTGTVTQINTSGGLTGGPITQSGTISIANNGVTESNIADNAVTSAKIADGNVNTAELAEDAVTLDKMASGTAGNLITYDASGNPAAVATGNSGDVLTSNGAGAAPTFQAISAGGGLQSMQVFTANGTWTKPAGITNVKVTVVGGGGSGGGRATDGTGGGGQAGGASIKFIDVSAISSVSVTVGAGGAASAASDSPGNAGNTSSFGTHCSATGGGAGHESSAARTKPNNPGVGSGGDINMSGGTGTQSWDTTQSKWTIGGNSIFGGGALVGAQGGAPGAGGGGGDPSFNDQAGGAGADGIVIVEEYA